MKWLFGGGPKRELGVELSKEDLADLALTLKDVAGRAMFGSASLVVSPGSNESIGFMRELALLHQRLEEEDTNPRGLRSIQSAVESAQTSFGEWQRGQTQETIGEFTTSLNSLMACVENCLGEQTTSSDALDQMQNRLSQARNLDDLSKVRDVLRQEVEVAKQLISLQVANQKMMQDRFNRAFDEMQSRISKAESAANTDHLTSLGNRAAFDFHLDSATQKTKCGNGPYSVAVFDLDEFKPINDKYGHAVGDQVLVAFATRIRQAFPTPAFVGRFGGDEFGVVANLNPLEIKRRVLRAQDDFESEPLAVVVEGVNRRLTIGFSYGAAEILASDIASIALARADQAMYEHKQRRKDANAA